MKNKAVKWIIFLLYTWVIYNLHVFFTASHVLAKDGFWDLAEFLVANLGGIILVVFLRSYTFLLWELHPLVVPLFLFIIILPVLLWIRRQTLFRAWILALAGTCLGPGVLLYLPLRFNPDKENGIYAFIGINLLFVALFWENLYGKFFARLTLF